MEFSRNQIGIAAGAGVLLLVIFFGYLMHLNGQGPVLGRSEERDPLSGIPNSISLNPLRDRTSEREAAKFIRSTLSRLAGRLAFFISFSSATMKPNRKSSANFLASGKSLNSTASCPSS